MLVLVDVEAALLHRNLEPTQPRLVRLRAVTRSVTRAITLAVTRAVMRAITRAMLWAARGAGGRCAAYSGAEKARVASLAAP